MAFLHLIKDPLPPTTTCEGQIGCIHVATGLSVCDPGLGGASPNILIKHPSLSIN